jgi:hypothetical protein
MNTFIKVLFLAGAVGVLPAGAYAAKAARAGKVARAIAPKARAWQRLTDEQKAAVKAQARVERAKVREEVRAIRKDPALTKPEKRAKARGAVVEARKELRRAVQKR